FPGVARGQGPSCLAGVRPTARPPAMIEAGQQRRRAHHGPGAGTRRGTVRGWWGLGLLLGVLLAACGGSSTPGGTTTAPAGSRTAPSTPGAATPAARFTGPSKEFAGYRRCIVARYPAAWKEEQ